LGLSFGYGLYGVGVSWVYVSLATYGGMPFWMGSIAVIGFAGILAVFVAGTGYITAKIFPHSRFLAIPLVWVIFEWGKSWVLTGFPWLDIGYTQTPTWLLAWAPVGSVYLVSLIVMIIAACLAYGVTKKAYLASAGTVVALLMVSYALTYIDWSQPTGEPITVGVVQPNTPIEEKWQPQYQTQVINKLARMSHQLHEKTKTDLIVWPESALPLYYQQTNEEFWQSVTPPNSAILSGILDSPSPANAEIDHVYNAAVLNCEGEQPLLYRKQHLVPFGEYTPLRFLFNWVIEYLNLPMSDMSAWQGAQSLSCGDKLKIGLSICYEDAFAAEYRDNLGDATILVNISEDAWFGDSLAPHQRTQMAQMRAAELARPLVRSANSGPSLIIDSKGHVLKSTAQFKDQSFSHEVQPHVGDSLFKRLGIWVIWLCFLMLGLLWFIHGRELARKRP